MAEIKTETQGIDEISESLRERIQRAFQEANWPIEESVVSVSEGVEWPYGEFKGVFSFQKGRPGTLGYFDGCLFKEGEDCLVSISFRGASDVFSLTQRNEIARGLGFNEKSAEVIEETKLSKTYGIRS